MIIGYTKMVPPHINEPWVDESWVAISDPIGPSQGINKDDQRSVPTWSGIVEAPPLTRRRSVAQGLPGGWRRGDEVRKIRVVFLFLVFVFV